MYRFARVAVECGVDQQILTTNIGSREWISGAEIAAIIWPVSQRQLSSRDSS